MATSIHRIGPQRETLTSQLAANNGHLVSPYGERRSYTLALAISVNETYFSALASATRGRKNKDLDAQVRDAFPCVPQYDLDWLDTVVNAARRSQLATLETGVLSALDMSREASRDVFAEAL